MQEERDKHTTYDRITAIHILRKEKVIINNLVRMMTVKI